VTSMNTHTVMASDTAISLGSGDVEVLGTPRLLAWLEGATVAVAAERLEPDQTSVGVAVRLRHRRPTPVGGTVEVSAKLRPESSDTRLSFAVRAMDANGQVVAEGEIDRAVVRRAAFGPPPASDTD
jgi:fluoroacetyl-CoA thioesterase